jgi:hypothetical protein
MKSVNVRPSMAHREANITSEVDDKDVLDTAIIVAGQAVRPMNHALRLAHR